MSKTYTPSATPSNKDKIRLLVGDTDSASMALHDEEIMMVLSEQSNVGLAAAACADLLAAFYAKQVNTKNGSISVNASDRVKSYRDLAARLRQSPDNPFAGTSYVAAVVVVGGSSAAERDTLAHNTDVIPPFFSQDSDSINANFAWDNDDHG